MYFWMVLIFNWQLVEYIALSNMHTCMYINGKEWTFPYTYAPILEHLQRKQTSTVYFIPDILL